MMEEMPRNSESQMKPFLVPDGQRDGRITVRPTTEQRKKHGILHFKGKQYRYLLFLCDRKEKQNLWTSTPQQVG